MSEAKLGIAARFRNSLQKKKKKKKKPNETTETVEHSNQNEIITVHQVNFFDEKYSSSLNDLVQTSKELMKEISKKPKKWKHEKIDLLKTELDRRIEKVKQCFWPHQEQRSRVNIWPHQEQRSRVDGSFGFKNYESRTRTRHEEEVEVYDREKEPIADYNFGERGREQERSYPEDRRFRRSQSVDEPKRSARRLQEELKVREEANARLQEKINKLQEDLNKNKWELDNEIKAREDAQNRLSELMGRQLKSKNPAITDLSDPDRPLNLVDKFCNIYDNEWTDVIDDIEKSSLDERTAVKILLTLVTDAYNECYNLRHKGKFFIGIENRSTSVQTKVNEIPDECRLMLKTIEVSQLKGIKEVLLNGFQSNVNRHILSCLANKPYIYKCIELCWMMVCHTPPLHLEWNYKGRPFDTSIMKPFTEPGITVDFMVWPVVFLHKDGPLLFKGVAQGCGSKQQTHF